MRLVEHMLPNLVFVLRGAADKAALLTDLVALVKAHFPSIDAEQVRTDLAKREAEASTGVGRGVAIPHSNAAGIDRILCAVAKIEDGIDFESRDDLPVTLVFLLLSPTGNVGTHLRLLARIARLTSNPAFVSKISGAGDPAAIFSLIEEEDARHV